LDPEKVGRGLKDALSGNATLLTRTGMAAALADPKRDRDKSGYAFGMSLGLGWKEGQVDLDPDSTLRGLRDSLSGGATLLTEPEMTAALAEYGRYLRVVQQRHRDKAAEENRREGEAFLAWTRTRTGVIVQPSGLQYEVMARGSGRSPGLADWVRVKYRSMRMNGAEFEASGSHPESGIFAVASVTKAWEEALQMMKPGDRWRLYVPPGLAFGRDGGPGVGPSETLVYDLELVSILPGQPQPTAEDLRNEREPDGD